MLLTDRFKIELEAARYPASYVVFDCIYRENREIMWEPLMERKNQLSRLVAESPRIAVSRFVEGQGRALYQAAEEKELEGVVAKRKDSSYLMGKRTKDWIRFKRMADEDYVVAGYIQKGRYTFSLIIGK